MEHKYNTHLTKTLKYYFTAKDSVVSSGYSYEIKWQDEVSIDSVDQKLFYSEYAWVVLSCGMRERVIRKKFEELSRVFEYWENPAIISRHASKYKKEALKIFNHTAKINAIVWMAKYLSTTNLTQEINFLKEKGTEYLCKFPFLGPATSQHFAKNIGIFISKPDRHLLRISKYLGYNSPDLLCKQISSIIGEKESIVDLILWRYATLNRSYLSA